MTDDPNGYFSGGGTPPPPISPPPMAPPMAPQAPPPGWNPYAAPSPTAPVWGGGGYVPAPNRPSHKRTWIIGGIALGILGVIAIVAAVSVFTRSTSGAKHAASDYLTDIETGNYGAAYSGMCLQDQATVSESTFASAKNANHPVTFSITRASVETSHGYTVGAVVYTEQETNGYVGRGIIPVEKIDGTWHVCHALIPGNTQWTTGG